MPPLAAVGAGGPAMSSSGGGAGGKRSVADVLMGNARDAARKTKKGAAAPSPKKPKTAQADDATVEPAVAEQPPSPAKSKRPSSPAKKANVTSQNYNKN